MDKNSLHAGLVVTVLIKFLYLFVASMLLGLSFGLGTSFLMKRAKSNSVPQVCYRHAYHSCTFFLLQSFSKVVTPTLIHILCPCCVGGSAKKFRALAAFWAFQVFLVLAPIKKVSCAVGNS